MQLTTKLLLYFFSQLIIYSNCFAQNSTENNKDSIFYNELNKKFVSNYPFFLAEKEEGGFFLIKLTLTDSAEKFKIELLNDGRQSCKEYFQKIFSKIDLTNTFSPGENVLIPVFFYDLSIDFGLSKRENELKNKQLIDNAVFKLTSENSNFRQNIILLKALKIAGSKSSH